MLLHEKCKKIKAIKKQKEKTKCL